MRDSDFTINGRKVIKGLDYFTNAKRVSNLDTATANCRSTGVKVPRSKVTFGIDWSKRSYRI
jgi:hypothetical protein